MMGDQDQRLKPKFRELFWAAVLAETEEESERFRKAAVELLTASATAECAHKIAGHFRAGEGGLRR